MLYISPIIYFSVCIILLFIDSIFTIKALKKYIKYFNESNYLVRAFITPLVPDIVCILNFLSRDIYNLFLGKLDTSVWCDISATLAVAHFLSLFGGFLFLAFSTYKMSIGEIISDKLIFIYNLVFWLFGLGYGIYLNQLNVLGEFDGLYCCILKDKLTHPSVILVTYIAIFIIIITIGYYILAYKSIQKEKKFIRIRDRVKEIILYRGFMFFISFFSCWSLMLYKLISKSFNLPELNLLLEMCASWTAKCMPLLNSLILLQLYNIIEEKEKLRVKIQEQYSSSIENLKLSV